MAGSLALFGLFRLRWAEAVLILPYTELQGRLATAMFGTSVLPVSVTVACSGTDALALCLGAVFAYPVLWRVRLAGATCGAMLILALNTIRIGTLGRAADSPSIFAALHLYVWPAVLTMAVAGYVFSWMRFADAPRGVTADARAAAATLRPLHLSRRLVLLTLGFLLLFTAASPLYLESATVLAVAAMVARAAAALLRVCHIPARAAGNVLWTSGGGFAVTQECISTPLIPLYLAAVCTYAPTRRRLAGGILATVPLFVALGIARLLVVAVPEVIASPVVLVHAFYQLLLAAVAIACAARWRHRGMRALGCAATGMLAGVLVVRLLGPVWTRVAGSAIGDPDDPQGALALLPSFQAGLFVGLAVAAVERRWKRLAAGLAALLITQVVGLAALDAIATHTSLAPHVRDVRAWAVAAPLLIFALVHRARPRC